MGRGRDGPCHPRCAVRRKDGHPPVPDPHLRQRFPGFVTTPPPPRPLLDQRRHVRRRNTLGNAPGPHPPPASIGSSTRNIVDVMWERDPYRWPMDERLIGARVGELRRRSGLTQQQVADAVGLSVESMSRLETGRTVPSVRRLADIADELGVELRDFFIFEPLTDKDRAIEELVITLRQHHLHVVQRIRRIVQEVTGLFPPGAE